MKLPEELKEFIEKEDVNTIENYFISTSPDCLGKLPIKQLSLVAKVEDAKNIFIKLGSQFNNIPGLNESWSLIVRGDKDYYNKIRDRIIKIIICWEIINNGLYLDGFACIVSRKELENFNYSKEALSIGIIKLQELKRSVEMFPEQNWSRDIIKELMEYGI